MNTLSMKDLKRCEEAIKLNKVVIKTSKSPHQRDLARMRIRILTRKKNEIRREVYNGVDK